MLYFKDKRGRVYRGLIRRLLGAYSPSLTMVYWHMKPGIFTKKQANKQLDAILGRIAWTYPEEKTE